LTIDRKKLEETILAKSKDGTFPCAVCFKIADDLGVPKILQTKEDHITDRETDALLSVTLRNF
jgi:hypothetical protein